MVNDEGVVAPTRSDPIARALSQVIGGPVGRPGTAAPVVSSGAHPARDRHGHPGSGHGAEGAMRADPWTPTGRCATPRCASPICPISTPSGLAEGVWPYSDSEGRYQVMEYPVGISYFAWATGRLTNMVGPDPRRPSAPRLRPDVLGLPGIGDRGQPVLRGQRRPAGPGGCCRRC